MFGRKKRQRRLEMIQGIRPTSKAALKHQCLIISRGNVKDAQELYDYYMDGMDDLPMFDPVAPTWMDNTKDTMNGIMGWIKENQSTLAQGYEFIRSIVQNKGALPPMTPIDTTLPPINE